MCIYVAEQSFKLELVLLLPSRLLPSHTRTHTRTPTHADSRSRWSWWCCCTGKAWTSSSRAGTSSTPASSPANNNKKHCKGIILLLAPSRAGTSSTPASSPATRTHSRRGFNNIMQYAYAHVCCHITFTHIVIDVNKLVKRPLAVTQRVMKDTELVKNCLFWS